MFKEWFAVTRRWQLRFSLVTLYFMKWSQDLYHVTNDFSYSFCVVLNFLKQVTGTQQKYFINFYKNEVNQSINQSWPLISSSSILSSSHLNTLRVSLHHSGSTRSFLVSVIHLEAYLAVTSFHPPSVTLMYKITKYSDHQSTHENDWKLHCRQHLLNLTPNA